MPAEPLEGAIDLRPVGAGDEVDGLGGRGHRAEASGCVREFLTGGSQAEQP